MVLLSSNGMFVSLVKFVRLWDYVKCMIRAELFIFATEFASHGPYIDNWKFYNDF